MFSTESIIIRLVLSVLIGGIIGMEREYRNKSAGFRTLVLICLGSCLFTMVSMIIGDTTSPDRIASNIVTGIGFLGGGVIFKSENGVNGLTTAATVWMTAALGMSIAIGYYMLSAMACVLVLMILFLFTYLEDVVDRINKVHQYRIVCVYEPDTLGKYEQIMKSHGLRVKKDKQSRINNEITGSWIVRGSAKNHQRFIETVLKDASIKEFDF